MAQSINYLKVGNIEKETGKSKPLIGLWCPWCGYKDEYFCSKYDQPTCNKCSRPVPKRKYIR